jgi:hypothetical protein
MGDDVERKRSRHIGRTAIAKENGIEHTLAEEFHGEETVIYGYERSRDKRRNQMPHDFGFEIAWHGSQGKGKHGNACEPADASNRQNPPRQVDNVALCRDEFRGIDGKSLQQIAMHGPQPNHRRNPAGYC